MAVNITPPPVIDLSRKPWETFTEDECYGGPYTITFNSNAAIEERTDQLGICKLNFQSNGPITFIDNKDSGERLNLEYQLRNGQQFEFAVRLDRNTLNQLETNYPEDRLTVFDFAAQITAVEQTSMISWYELDFLKTDISLDPADDHVTLGFGDERTMTHTRAFLRKVERRWDGPKPWPNGEDLGFIATAEYPEGQPAAWKIDVVGGANTAEFFNVQVNVVKVPAGQSTAAHAKIEFTYDRREGRPPHSENSNRDLIGGLYSDEIEYEIRPIAGPDQVLTDVAGNDLPPLRVTLSQFV